MHETMISVGGNARAEADDARGNVVEPALQTTE